MPFMSSREVEAPLEIRRRTEGASWLETAEKIGVRQEVVQRGFGSAVPRSGRGAKSDEF